MAYSDGRDGRRSSGSDGSGIRGTGTPGVVHIQWYATVLRQDLLAAEIARAARVSLRYGASQFSVQRSRDDRYKVIQMVWFESQADWYRYWDGPEMIAFRRRNSGHYQIPVAYVWHDEIDFGALGPEVLLPAEPSPEPEPEPEVSVT